MKDAIKGDCMSKENMAALKLHRLKTFLSERLLSDWVSCRTFRGKKR